MLSVPSTLALAIPALCTLTQTVLGLMHSQEIMNALNSQRATAAVACTVQTSCCKHGSKAQLLPPAVLTAAHRSRFQKVYLYDLYRSPSEHHHGPIGFTRLLDLKPAASRAGPQTAFLHSTPFDLNCNSVCDAERSMSKQHRGKSGLNYLAGLVVFGFYGRAVAP